MANQPVSPESIVSDVKFVETKVNQMTEFMKETISQKGHAYEEKNVKVKQSLQHQMFEIIDMYEKEISSLEQEYDRTGNSRLIVGTTVEIKKEELLKLLAEEQKLLQQIITAKQLPNSKSKLIELNKRLTEISNTKLEHSSTQIHPTLIDIDKKYKQQIVKKIDLILNGEEPLTKEMIAKREKKWLANTKRRKDEFLRSPEGREIHKLHKEAMQLQFERKKNAKVSIIGKILRGNNYSEQLDELNDYIDSLDPEIRRIIEKEEQRLVRGGEIQKQKVRERYEQQRAGVIEIHERRNGRYNAMVGEEQSLREHNDRLKKVDEAEENAMIPIDMRTEESIIHMKEQYKYHKRLPDESESISPESVETGEEPIEIEESPEPLDTPITKQENKLPEPNYDKIYIQSIIHHKISVPFIHIGNNMPKYFKKFASRHIEGKCRKEGFIRPNSTQVVSYSTGLLNADNVLYDVVFSCDVCYPCEDMILKCKIVNITKIGIRGIISEVNNPIVLFISREHNVNRNFEDYEEGEMINIKVIGHRFELNDEYISVIGEII